MEQHRLPDVDEHWLDQWIAWGLREIDEYLARHAEFTEWLEAQRTDA